MNINVSVAGIGARLRERALERVRERLARRGAPAAPQKPDADATAGGK